MLVSMCCKRDIYLVQTECGNGHYVCRMCNLHCQPLLVNDHTPLIYDLERQKDADV
jgi:hypothetical protein